MDVGYATNAMQHALGQITHVRWLHRKYIGAIIARMKIKNEKLGYAKKYPVLFAIPRTYVAN